MKKSWLLPSLFSIAAIATLLVFAPVVRAASVSASASASVNLKLAPDPSGLFLVGKPSVPIVSPHRITLGLVRGGVVRTRVFGMGTGRVVFLGARARPYVLVGSPMVVVGAPGVVVGSPGVVVGSPGVIVQQPTVVVQQPGVIVQQPAVVVGFGMPGVVVARPSVHVGVSPVVVVGGGGKHDNGHHNGHHKGRSHGRGKH